MDLPQKSKQADMQPPQHQKLQLQQEDERESRVIAQTPVPLTGYCMIGSSMWTESGMSVVFAALKAVQTQENL